jgi:hypothetical protein
VYASRLGIRSRDVREAVQLPRRRRAGHPGGGHRNDSEEEETRLVRAAYVGCSTGHLQYYQQKEVR